MLTVSDDSGNSPQTVTLTGTGGGSALSIGEAPGSSTSATVTGGGTASYSLSLLSSGGFTGAVALSCSGAPANSTCMVDPATLNVTADGSTTFKVTVATNVSQSSRIGSSDRIMLSGLAALSLLIPFVAHWRRSALACLVLLLGITTGLILGCGGGSGSGGSGTPSGGSVVTPSGTYTLTVQAASGSVTATQAITLTVQ